MRREWEKINRISTGLPENRTLLKFPETIVKGQLIL